jgi:opacity protein-like surface antigen
MKKTLATLLASIAFVGTAVAADLPRKSTPAAPVSAVESYNGWYVGGNFGGSLYTKGDFQDAWDKSKPSVGAVGGYQFNRNFGAEVTYDYFFKRNGVQSGQTAFVNGTAGMTVPGTKITPYALAGVGYGWDYFGDRKLYNVGAGVRTEITKAVDFDLRYRYINNWDNTAHSNVVTGGVNYKF